MDNAALNYLKLVEKLQGFREDLPEADDIITDAIDAITRLVMERDEAREGLDRLEAAYGILSDDVFSARPKIAAMAKELSEAKAQRDAALADVRMWEASVADDWRDEPLNLEAASCAIGGGE